MGLNATSPVAAAGPLAVVPLDPAVDPAAGPARCAAVRGGRGMRRVLGSWSSTRRVGGGGTPLWCAIHGAVPT